MEQIETTTQQAEATYRQAELDRDLASLNLERSSVKAPVNGVITNFSLQPGDYVTTGSAVTALVDTDSFMFPAISKKTNWNVSRSAIRFWLM